MHRRDHGQARPAQRCPERRAVQQVRPGTPRGTTKSVAVPADVLAERSELLSGASASGESPRAHLDDLDIGRHVRKRVEQASRDPRASGAALGEDDAVERDPHRG